jgi:hypothetical protein
MIIKLLIIMLFTTVFVLVIMILQSNRKPVTIRKGDALYFICTVQSVFKYFRTLNSTYQDSSKYRFPVFARFQ